MYVHVCMQKYVLIPSSLSFSCRPQPCQCLGEFFCPPDRPSPIFLTYSAIVCGIPAVVAVMGMASGTDCGNLMAVSLTRRESYNSWLCLEHSSKYCGRQLAVGARLPRQHDAKDHDRIDAAAT